MVETHQNISIPDLAQHYQSASSELRAEFDNAGHDSLNPRDQGFSNIIDSPAGYAMLRTLERHGIESLDISETDMSDSRATIEAVLMDGNEVLKEAGIAQPDLMLYESAAQVARATDAPLEDVVRDFENQTPMMIRQDLSPQNYIPLLPDQDVLSLSNLGSNFFLAQTNLAANNSAEIQKPVGGDTFRGGVNYCSASHADINFKDHSPKGNLVDADDNFIRIYPRAGSVPQVTIPNTVGADGFSTWNLSDHVYNIYTDTRGKGLKPDDVSEALANNPTPGPNNNKATADGTRNNAGPIERPILSDYKYDNGNWVRSFSVDSPDPEIMTDMVVNYTIEGEHLLHEGYVIRYGVVEDGEVVGIRSYGEGHAWEQAPFLSGAWCSEGKKVWQENHDEVINSAGM